MYACIYVFLFTAKEALTFSQCVCVCVCLCVCVCVHIHTNTQTHTHTHTHTQTKTQNHKKPSDEEQARENALGKVCRVLRRHVTLRLTAATVRAWRNRLKQRQILKSIEYRLVASWMNEAVSQYLSAWRHHAWTAGKEH
jgi:hypothetical protein